MAVRWVRCLTPFQTLSRSDQQLLLQESWKELFLLYLAQWSSPWDLGALMNQRLARHHAGRPADNDLLIATEVKTIQVLSNNHDMQFKIITKMVCSICGSPIII